MCYEKPSKEVGEASGTSKNLFYSRPELYRLVRKVVNGDQVNPTPVSSRWPHRTRCLPIFVGPFEIFPLISTNRHGAPLYWISKK